MSDPTGVQKTEVLNDSINVVLDSWAEEKKENWTKIRGAWITSVGYIISAGDFFIQKVDLVMEGEKGSDKKATVLAALGQIYDKIVLPLLPIWLKPFNYKIKDFVIYVIASIMVDFFVSKYKSGIWKSEAKNFSDPIFTKIFSGKTS